jgi:RNA polymerase sigma-32 factor
VNEQDVIDMDQRMGAHDQHLNAPMGGKGGDSDTEFMDMLADPSENQEEVLAESEDFQQKKALMMQAISSLNAREQQIIMLRRMSDEPITLEDLSVRFGISRERVRQIETRALEKMTAFVMTAAAKVTAAALPAPKAA